MPSGRVVRATSRTSIFGRWFVSALQPAAPFALLRRARASSASAAATAFGFVYVHPFDDGACVRRTVDDDLPREIDCLRRHDLALQRIMDAVEMPDRIAENLVLFIRQHDGTLSKNRREGEFKQFTDDEVRRIERIVADAFEGLAR